MSQSARVLVAEAEFLALPTSLERTELIDGEVCVAPSPSYWHQELLSRVLVSLRSWSAGIEKPWVVARAPLDVKRGPNRIVQPDAFVMPGTLSREHEGPITEIPTVCVEVLSSNRVYDRVFKRMLYAEAGVLELWLVEADGSIERFHGAGLVQANFVRDTLAGTVLPGFQLSLKSLRE